MNLRPGVRARARGEYRSRVDCGLMLVLLLALQSVHQHMYYDLDKTLTRSCSSVVPEMTSRFPCIFAILPSGQIPAHPLPIPVRQLGIQRLETSSLQVEQGICLSHFALSLLHSLQAFCPFPGSDPLSFLTGTALALCFLLGPCEVSLSGTDCIRVG
jgi:hypothetical protein